MTCHPVISFMTTPIEIESIPSALGHVGRFGIGEPEDVRVASPYR
jgi:hypothetical protein